jgi:phosphonate transport system ATP-binding protein
MQYCPRTIALRRGKVVYDGPSAALTADLLKKLYGDDARELLDETAQREDSVAASRTSAQSTPGAAVQAEAMSAPPRYAFAIEPARSN